MIKIFEKESHNETGYYEDASVMQVNTTIIMQKLKPATLIMRTHRQMHTNITVIFKNLNSTVHL